MKGHVLVITGIAVLAGLAAISPLRNTIPAGLIKPDIISTTPTPRWNEEPLTLNDEEKATMAADFAGEFPALLASYSAAAASEASRTATPKVKVAVLGLSPTPTIPGDRTPPSVTISGGPAEGSTYQGTSVCFPLWVTDDTTVYTSLKVHTRMDSAVWSDWSTNLGPCFDNLTPGVHTFGVQIRDDAGNLSPEQSRTFTSN